MPVANAPGTMSLFGELNCKYFFIHQGERARRILSMVKRKRSKNHRAANTWGLHKIEHGNKKEGIVDIKKVGRKCKAASKMTNFKIDLVEKEIKNLKEEKKNN